MAKQLAFLVDSERCMGCFTCAMACKNQYHQEKGVLWRKVYPLAEAIYPLVNQILLVSLIVGLVVYLVVPCIWLSGGEIMRQTGQSWISSPLYWARIAVGLVLPLVVIGTTKKTPGWLWLVILAGELAARAVFFANTVHSVTNMGGVY